ncbi:hypothetical protein PRNP1_007802 [Phytophthora ramorum]
MIHAPLVVESLLPSAPTAPSAADLLSRYTRFKKLRSTLYGETALYQDEELKQLVVLKRLSIPLLQQDDGCDAVKENPLSERAVIQLLEDPLTARAPGREHVVDYEREGFFMSGDSVFVAMEFCAGGDLYDYVTARPGRRLPEREALPLFAQIVKGLSFLHAIGVAHRDLSLENVLLKDGQVKICDFGLSADANQLSTDVVGKFYYMAPEVTRGAATGALMAPAPSRALATPQGPLGPNRPILCSPDAGASRGAICMPHPEPDRLLSRLEAVDRFALYGRQHAHVDHISGTQEGRSIILQSTMLLQEDGLLAARLDDVTYLLDGLLSMKTQRGQARSVLELTKLLQDPQLLQAVDLSNQRRRIQDRTRQLLLRMLTQDQEETCQLALAVLVYVLSCSSEMHELLDDKVLDVVVLALKREVARENTGEKSKAQLVAEAKQVDDVAVPLKKTCLKRKQTSGKKPLKKLSKETETGASAPRLVSDESCRKLLSELLQAHEAFCVDGELRLSTADALCAALHNLLQVDCSSSDSCAELNVAQRYQQRQGARIGDTAGDVFKVLRARKLQLVRNGGVDALVYGLAHQLKILTQLLPSSLDEAVRREFAHCLHRVRMLLCVFDQVTFLIVDVQQYISKRRTLFVLLLKLIRLLSELCWSDQARERWESETTRMSLGVEVLLSALRVLINLTHHNNEAAKHLHALGGMQLLANSFSQLWGLVRSAAVANQLQHSQGLGKWEFDACLLLLSVMVNSIEFSDENHAALSRASLPLGAVSGDDTDMIMEAEVGACDLFARFFLAKVQSYVDLINLAETGGAYGAISIKEDSDDWSPEDVILGGCTSLLLGYLMKGSSANSTVILMSLPDNSPRLLLRALGVFVAFHSQVGALTPDVANSVLHVEKVLKSYQRGGLGMIKYEFLPELTERSATARGVNLAAVSDIDEVSTVSIEDADEAKHTGVSSSPIRARPLKNVCSSIDDSDEDDISPFPNSQAFRMRTPTRTPPRSPGKKRLRSKSPVKTPLRTREERSSRDSRLSVTAVHPDGSLSSPVVARLLKRTRQLVDEFDAGFMGPSRFSPEKGSGVSSEEIVTTDSTPSACVVLTMDVTCRDNGNDGLDVSQDVEKEHYSNVGSSKSCAEHNVQVGFSSKRKKKPMRNPNANSKSAATYQETSFGFTPSDTPPSTPLREKNRKVLLQTPTRNGRSPGNYRQSPSLKLKTSPSTPLRIKKSAELLQIPSKNGQSPIVDQPQILASPHGRKTKGARAPSAPASCVFDFTG